MKKLNLILFLLSLIVFVGCNRCETKEISVEVNQYTYLENLSSASAVWCFQDGLYLAGDDVPWLYQLNDGYKVMAQTRLSGVDSLIKGRTPGSIKADFESMEVFSLHGDQMLLVLPSGSQPISRDTAYLVSLENSQPLFKRNIRRLYNKIIARAGIASEELNIEGLAIDDENIYLFQRGNLNENFIVKLARSGFFNYFLHQTILPDFSINKIELPEFNGFKAGLSGACVLPDQSGMLFTASLEGTDSALADGEVFGSYIGFIPFCKLKKGDYTIAMITKDNQPITQKIEGISIKQQLSNSLYKVITVCDNDDGSSGIIEVTVGLN